MPIPNNPNGFTLEHFQDTIQKQLLDLIDHFIVAFDHDLCLLFANRTALKHCNKYLSEIIYQPLFNVFPELQGFRYKDGSDLLDASKVVWRSHELQYLYVQTEKNKPAIPLELHRFFPIMEQKDSANEEEVKAVLLLITSISADSNLKAVFPGNNRLAQRAALAAQTTEQQNHQISNLLRFSITAADRINTPLNVILGRAELIRNFIATSHPLVFESLDVISLEVKRLSNLVEELNLLAKPFTDEFPDLLQEQAQSSGFVDPSRSSVAPLERTPSHILVVDDEEHMLDLLRDTVATLGYHPVTATTGSQALEQLSTKTVDLVITDINMPGMSGIELLKRVKRQKPRLPVILITGFGKDRAEAAAQEHQADGFLGKPFHLDELKQCIEKLLR